MYIQEVGRIRPKVFIKKVGANRVQVMYIQKVGRIRPKVCVPLIG